MDEQQGKLPFVDRLLQRLLSAPIGIPQPRKHAEVRVRDVFRVYLQSVRLHRAKAIVIFVTGVLGSSIAVLEPYLFKRFLDVISSGDPSVLPAAMTALFFMFSVILGRIILKRTNYIMMGGLAARVMANLKQRAFEKLLRHSDRFFASTFTGSLVQRVNRLAASYDRLADRFMYDLVPITIQIVGVMTVLAFQNLTITAIMFFWLLAFLGWNTFFARWKLKYDAARAEADSRSTGYLADVVTNHQTVELFGSHERENAGYKEVTDRQGMLQRFSWQAGSIIDGMQAVFVVVAQFAIFMIGLDLWSKGEFSIGLFVLTQTYLLQLSESLWHFSRTIRDSYEAFADAKEMVEIMQMPQEITETKDAYAIEAPKGSVEFRNVRFLMNERVILNDVSFTIKAGERVAIVGPSGAGKSTLVKLLFRQYDPDEGAILVDGKDIASFTLTSLRDALCLVPQEPLLFHRSLRENIRYARPLASDEDVVRAAEFANASEFILRSTNGLDTFVGERGIKLSGGERQRVAIARAFLKDSPVIVFDEATSSLDSESEQKIQDALDRLMRHRTTIVIAHRLSTIKRMDRIIVVDEGKVVEQGTHEELLALGEVYEHLWSLQQGGFLTQPENISDEKGSDDDKA